jgi:IQ calmodulin-binding motif
MANLKREAVDGSTKYEIVTTVPDMLQEDAASASICIRDEEVFAVSGLKLEKSVAEHIWNSCLGLMALADFSAAMARRHAAEVEPTSTDMKDTVVYWLYSYSNTFGMLFSLLWFMDAFVGAHRKRMEAVRKYDKERLLDKKMPWDDMDAAKQWWRGFQGVYYRTIALQILLLPVGFFVFWYNRARQLHDPHLVVDDSVILVVHHTDDDNIPDESEVFSTHASISLGYAVLNHLIITVARRTGNHVRLHAIAKAKSVAYKVTLRGLRHPIRFNRRVRRGLSVIRWIQYLAPLIGTGIKLKGNVSDLMTKYKQHQEAGRAKVIRTTLWHAFSKDELREYCATLIQRSFRAHQARKKFYIVKVIKCQKETIAAIKLQCALRGWLARARARLKGNYEHFRSLKTRKRSASNGTVKRK